MFSRSEVSNWAVSIGVPAVGLNHDLYTSLELTCAAALLLLVIAIGLAGYQSNQITSELQALIAPAMAFARGEMPTIPRLRIREVGEVAQALDRAHQVLQRRTDECDRAEREKEVAESAARLKGEFIGTVSHELRTPLTSITASLGLLNGTADVNRSDATNRLIAIAHANSQRLVRLVNDILDIEKLEAEKVVFDMQRVEIGSLLERTIEACRPLAESCGVRLRFENSSLLDVHADPDRLTQVVSNLLSNAIKFTPPEAEVVVTLEDRGDLVRISVRDHGPGIPKSFRHRVFAKFAQADASDARQKSGTELGLSIVEEIVQRLDGEVGFSDAPGGGTNFFVELPHLERIDGGDARTRILLCEDDTSTAAVNWIAKQFDEARLLGQIRKAIGRNGNRPVRVLHLDDDPDVLAIDSQAFDADADVVSATTMENARQALATVSDGFRERLRADAATLVRCRARYGAIRHHRAH